jgi:hypothetical protein
MRASEPPLAETYEDSGWCYVEAAISAAIKPGFLRLDLAKRTEQAMACAYGPNVKDRHGSGRKMLACVCARVCALRRPPPPPPETVRHLLQTEKRFTNSSDVSKVGDMYETFFNKVIKVDELKFQGLEWDDAKVENLCEVLPRFAALRTLDLSNNYKIGPEGAKAISRCLQSGMAVLTELLLSHNNIRAKGAMSIAGALSSGKAVLTSLYVGYNNLTEQAALSIVRAARQHDKITNLGLSDCKIGPIGAKEIADYIQFTAVLTTLWLDNNKVGGEGAMAIAEALKFSATPVLTELRLKNNKIGGEGAKAIADTLQSGQAVLKICDLLKNNLDFESATMLAKIGAEKGIMLSGMKRDQTEAYFYKHRLQPADGILIASDLQFMVVLTKLGLKKNNMGDAGKQAVRDAVRGRSGFKLEL